MRLLKDVVTMKRFLLILISGIIITMLSINVFLFWGSNKTYDLQLGHVQNQESPKMNDHYDHFKNDQQLIAMAIYPDKKEALRQAQLYVTQKGSSEVLQVEKWIERADLAAMEMRMKNLDWAPGEYTLYFKRGLDIQKSLDFTLE